MVTEAEKAHNLPSVNWRTRKAGGIVKSKSKGLRAKGADGVSPVIWRPEKQELWYLRVVRKDGHSSSRKERVNHPFCFTAGASIDWIKPSHLDKGNLYYLLNPMLISSRNTLRDTPGDVLPVMWYPLAQSSWHIKLIITVTENNNLLLTLTFLWID